MPTICTHYWPFNTSIVRAAVCNDKQVVESTTITTDSGHTLKMQTYTCSNTVHSSLSPLSAVEKRNNLALKKRDSRCTGTGPCLCGVACESSIQHRCEAYLLMLPCITGIFDDCRAENQSIRQTDCATIISVLQTNCESSWNLLSSVV